MLNMKLRLTLNLSLWNDRVDRILNSEGTPEVSTTLSG